MAPDPVTPRHPRRRQSLRQLLPGATIVLLAVGLFLTSLPGTFIVDDWLVIVDNPLITGPDLPTILTSDYWGPGANNGQYRPLVILSYALNHALFGPEAFSFHVVNILLHAAVCLSLFLLGVRLAFPPGVAWLAAALFAAHPIHLEAVNMIVGRAELLAGLFGLFFLILARSPFLTRRLCGLVCLLGALLSKESAVVFPALLVAIDLFAGAAASSVLRSRWRYYGAIAVLTTCWLLLLLWVQQLSGSPRSPIDPHDNPLAFLDLLPRLLSALKIQVLYLARLLLPLGLHGVSDSSSVILVDRLLSPWGIAVTAFAVATAALQVRLWRRRRTAALGVLLYLLGFAVTANVFFTHYVMMADRLAYLPSAGFCLAVAALLYDVTPAGPAPARRVWRTALGLAYFAMLGILTIARNPDYREPRRLWEKTLRAEPGNARAWIYLGDVLGRAGDLSGAETAYRTAIRVAPRFSGGWDQAAYVLLLQGRGEEALAIYRGELAAAGRDLPSVRLRIAKTLLELGRPSEALQELAAVTSPEYKRARHALESRAVELLKSAKP